MILWAFGRDRDLLQVSPKDKKDTKSVPGIAVICDFGGRTLKICQKSGSPNLGPMFTGYVVRNM